jgi:hypothetical protein
MPIMIINDQYGSKLVFDPHRLIFPKDKKMDADIFEYIDELDCEVTVFDGAFMTCDMIEDEISEGYEFDEDFEI